MKNEIKRSEEQFFAITMEKEVSASVRKEEMALSETNCIKENKTEVSNSKMEPR